MALGLGINTAPLVTPLKWLPSDLVNQRLYLWLQNGVGLATGAWLDSSSEENNATQVVSGNRPTVSQGGLEFDQSGILQWMDLTNLITIPEDTGFTLSFTVTLDNVLNNVILSDSVSEFIEIMNSKRIRLKTNNPSGLSTTLFFDTAIFTENKSVITLQRARAAGTFTVWVNGEKSIPNASTVNAVNTGGFDISNVAIRNDNDRALDGLLYELVLYNTAINPADINNLNNYMIEKFNIE
jgi:hypothetical protein